MNKQQEYLISEFRRNHEHWKAELNRVQNNRIHLSEEEFEHVWECVESMIRDYAGICEAGSFIRAVIRNDMMDAFRHADDTNLKAVWCYCYMIYNFVPGDLVSKRRGR